MNTAAAVETVMAASVRLPPSTPSDGKVVVAFVVGAAVVVVAPTVVVATVVVVVVTVLLATAVASAEFESRVIETTATWGPP